MRNYVSLKKGDNCLIMSQKSLHNLDDDSKLAAKLLLPVLLPRQPAKVGPGVEQSCLPQPGRPENGDRMKG